MDNINIFEDDKFLEACKKDLITDKDFRYMKNKNESLLLIRASKRGYTNLVKTLLDRGGIYANSKHTALISATSHSKYDCMNMLLDYGANVNTRDSDGNTPLIYAAAKGLPFKVFQILFEHDVDPEVRSLRGDTYLAFLDDGDKEKINEIIKNIQYKNIKPARR